MPPSPSIENPSTIGRLGSTLWQSWEWILQACFALLCFRFLIATVRETTSIISPNLLIIAGSFLLGYSRPAAALFAFTSMAPFISGLTQTVLLSSSTPISIIFSALWLGLLISKFRTRMHLIQEAPSRLSLVINLLASAILISLIERSLAHAHHNNFTSSLLSKPWPAYSDPYYFLTSSHIWLQGLFYFREITAHTKPSSINEEKDAASTIRIEYFIAIIAIYNFSIAIFIYIQHKFQLPEGWAFSGYQSPYEDIGSLGGISASLFIFWASSLRIKPINRNILGSILAASSLIFLISSWSRAAWLAGMTGAALIALLRTNWRSRIVIVLVCVSLFTALAQMNKSEAWQKGSFAYEHTYLWRLGQLVNFESPTRKDPGRINLYHKSLKMIAAHPIIGHGIGSFYLKSTKYADPDDEFGLTPNFAHNILFQIAAELGIPVALLFASLCAWAIWRGFIGWSTERSVQTSRPSPDLPVFAVTLSLGAYLQTQMTANSLNIYISNQFFFWFMIAILLRLTHYRNLSRKVAEFDSATSAKS